MALPKEDHLDRAALTGLQERRLSALLSEILPRNRFYAEKFARARLDPKDVRCLSDLARVPFTTKAELIADQEAHPPYGSVLTYPLSRYCRMHQTSGTSARPMRWLDTPESWRWHLDCWDQIFNFVHLRPEDRLFFPYSFGPFLAFWAAFEAATRRGQLSLPGGGMSSSTRLRFLLSNEATVILCTPSYALRLAEVAREEHIDLATSPVRVLVVAGEPGGSILATRARIEAEWGARVFDHSGMTEAGALGIECLENPCGLHLLETECVAEVIDPDTCKPISSGELGELVLTNLGRWGSPLLRYRTGDLVRVDPRPCHCGRVFVRLQGGILGRTDDMIHLRGNNVYPGALEAVIRQFAEVAEFRLEADYTESLPVLRVEIEPVTAELATRMIERVDQAIRDQLLFRAEVRAVSPGSLPRFEGKARRFTRKLNPL